jgi:hypothetical protein
MLFRYPWQKASAIEVYTDTGFAGCPRTRKSTSGGCVLIGRHTIKTWSSTQTSIALSSGEAEFNGVVRGSGVGLGYQSLLRDLGLEIPLRVWTDSSAAVGICNRQGLGGVRHLDTHTLWVQQAVRCKKVDLRKVDGEVNPADVFTKHSLTRDRLMKLVDLFEFASPGGRAQSAPMMRDTPSAKVTMAEVNHIENDGEDHDANSKEVPPMMPHKSCNARQLELNYPPLSVPEEDDHDYDEEGDDPMLQEGNRIARVIARDAKEHGRRKKAGGDLSTAGRSESPNQGCIAVLLSDHASERGVHGDSAECPKLRHVSSRVHGSSAERPRRQQTRAANVACMADRLSAAAEAADGTPSVVVPILSGTLTRVTEPFFGPGTHVSADETRIWTRMSSLLL